MRSSEEVALYTAKITNELARMAEEAGLLMLAYLLEMAREEATMQAEDRGRGRRRISR
ncbi:hypothetical protein [Segnochrobactrum spirostomi]|uniref:hypothetical protein n=1 Tax=Segnochrobactrum spirostomi TaxID=2608987 RepID=UPI001AD83A3A|nr:hypothetical protein [Segnochrobactrum spirostomi]